MNKKRYNTNIASLIVTAVSLLIAAFGLYTEVVEGAQAISIVFLGGLIAAYLKFGFNSIKMLGSIFAVLYSLSMYNLFAMNITNYVIQPAMLSIASVMLFISSTYRQNVSSVRSRKLWVPIFAIFLSGAKIASIIYTNDFIITEAIGAIVTVIAIGLWNIWIAASPKTRIVAPELNEVEGASYIAIETNEILDVNKLRWHNLNGHDGENAKPYLIENALTARENDKILIIANSGSDKHHTKIEFSARHIKVSFIYTEGYNNYEEIAKEYNN